MKSRIANICLLTQSRMSLAILSMAIISPALLPAGALALGNSPADSVKPTKAAPNSEKSNPEKSNPSKSASKNKKKSQKKVRKKNPAKVNSRKATPTKSKESLQHQRLLDEVAKEEARARGRARRAARAKQEGAAARELPANISKTTSRRTTKSAAGTGRQQKLERAKPCDDKGSGTCDGDHEHDGEWQSTCHDKSGGKLTKPTKGDGPGLPKLKVENTLIVNNEVWRGDMVECFWRLKNSGDAPLRIRAKGG